MPADYKYLVDNAEFPYCSGCGHTWINKALDSALQKLNVKPTKVNLITDIGCVGLVDKLFLTNTIHTTHGRSAAFACGIELADSILYDSDSVNIVMIGDGGATIGVLHLLEAAKFNANITVILHNNFVYGMTGGQSSGLTPENFRTATNMDGVFIPAIKILDLLKAANASYLSRKLATDRDLDDAIVAAVQHQGFSLIEVIELCTGYATKWNKLNKTEIENILKSMNCDQLGTIVDRDDRKTFSHAYREKFPVKENISDKISIIDATEASDQKLHLDLVLAGSAGEGVQFAAATFAKSFLKQGYNISQKNDNPITIGTGFSFSEIKISAQEILYSAINAPDYLVISSLDGLLRSKDFISQAKLVLIDSSLDDRIKQFKPKKLISKDFKGQLKSAKNINLAMLTYLLKQDTKLNPERVNRTSAIGLGQGICERGTGVDFDVNEDAERANNAEISQSRLSCLEAFIETIRAGKNSESILKDIEFFG